MNEYAELETWAYQDVDKAFPGEAEEQLIERLLADGVNIREEVCVVEYQFFWRYQWRVPPKQEAPHEPGGNA